MFADITERKQAEAALRESEERQAFLLGLSDALRPLLNPAEIQETAARLLGTYLGADRAGYAEMESNGEWMTVARDWTAPGVASVVGRHRIDDFGHFFAGPFREGRTAVIADAAHDPRVPADAYAATWGAIGVRSAVACPLVKGNQLVAAIFVHAAAPRPWSAGEVARVQEVVARTWDAVERARAETALRETAERHRFIVEGARDYAILTTDPDGRIESWSPGAEAVFGWSSADAIGQSVDLTFLPEDRAAGEPERERALARERGVAPDVRWHMRDDGGRVFIEGTTRALRDEMGLRGFVKVGQDVTRRRELDEALRASETRYRALVENVQDYAIYLLDAQGVVTEWTPGAELMMGYTADDVAGRHTSLFYPPEAVAMGEPDRELATAAATGRAETEALRMRRGGERFWANEIVTTIHDRDGRLLGFAKIARDLTERRAAEAVMERARAASERDELRRQLVQAEDEERRRLSRELHDEAGQHLTALGLGLQALSDVAVAGSEVDRRATQLRELASTLGRELHALAVRLRPKALDDFGLEAAVAAYAEEWSRQSGIAVDVHAPREAERLSSAIESAVYRVVQEALTNIARHSGATHASLVLERREGQVVAVVEDDGRGFEAGTEARAADAPALGLLGVRERVALLDGSVTIESSPGAGTSVYVRIPIAAPSNGSHDRD